MRWSTIFATVFGRYTRRLLVSVLGSFNTSTVLPPDKHRGKTKITSLLLSFSNTSRFTLCSSFSMKMEAVPFSIFSSDTSIQSSVMPSISPIRSVQEKARFNANDKSSSSQSSSAFLNVGKSHIALFLGFSLGMVACSTGFLVINSHLTAWLKAFRKSLCTSLILDGVRYSCSGLRLLITFDLTFRRSR